MRPIALHAPHTIIWVWNARRVNSNAGIMKPHITFITGQHEPPLFIDSADTINYFTLFFLAPHTTVWIWNGRGINSNTHTMKPHITFITGQHEPPFFIHSADTLNYFSHFKILGIRGPVLTKSEEARVGELREKKKNAKRRERGGGEARGMCACKTTTTSTVLADE
jgi:hypothetical protein